MTLDSRPRLVASLMIVAEEVPLLRQALKAKLLHCKSGTPSNAAIKRWLQTLDQVEHDMEDGQ